jgi:fibrillarin-like pre-rRNA processing protein
MHAFGKKGTHGLLVIKARSVDFSKPPEQVMKRELGIIKKHYSVLQTIELGKFEKSHFLIHCRRD